MALLLIDKYQIHYQLSPTPSLGATGGGGGSGTSTLAPIPILLRDVKQEREVQKTIQHFCVSL